MPGIRGWPNSRMASRPRGRSTRDNSASARSGSATFLMPNAIVAASHEASATGRYLAELFSHEHGGPLRSEAV